MKPSNSHAFLIPLLLTAIGALLFWAFWIGVTGYEGERLATLALERVPESGAGNPVTSVLLNFRAYDTLMELAVLLAALLGIWSLGPAAVPYQRAALLLDSLVGWVVPMLIIAGGYLLWVGGHAPGGAFQAGALLGAAGVALALSGRPSAGLPGESRLRVLAALGTLVFVLVGLMLMGLGLGFLTYPPALAKVLILAIETGATLSIGATLAAAFLGGRPRATGAAEP
ncbi:MnhB domain-containing protein [Allochromatium tepidum]|nr:MnhB domain-containing protein [Allochromatium tepidum]